MSEYNNSTRMFAQGATTLQESMGENAALVSLAKQAATMHKLMGENAALISLAKQAATMHKLMGENTALISVAKQAATMHKLMGENAALISVARQAATMHKLMGENAALISPAKQAATMHKLVGENAALINFAKQAATIHKLVSENAALINLAKQAATMQNKLAWQVSASSEARMARQVAVLSTQETAFGIVAPAASLDFAPLSRELERIGQGLRQHSPATDVLALLSDLFDILLRLLEEASTALETRAAAAAIQLILPIVVAIWLAVSSDHNIQNVGASIRHEMHSDDAAIGEEIDRAKEQQHGDLTNMNAKLDELVTLLNDKAQKANGEFYVVVRAVPLCKAMKYHGPRLALLTPATEVEVLTHRKKWLFVRLMIAPHEIREGWVLKKYLQRVR